MKIRIEEKEYEGTPVEILDDLRVEANRGIPTVADYICFVQDNIRQMGNDCHLERGSTEQRALSLIHRLKELYALEIQEDAYE